MAEDRLSAIFNAALHLFAANGFERTSMDEVAAKAGVAKGTIFYHYKSKEELFQKMIRRGVDLLIDTIHKELAGIDDPGEQLQAVIRIQTTLLHNHPEFCRILLGEVWGNQERQKLMREALMEYFRLVEAIVTEGVHRRGLRPIDAATVADAVFGMMATVTVRLLVAPAQRPLDRVIADLQALLMGGVLLP